MEKLINQTDSEMKIITPDDGYHYFFAYYDMRATGETGRHLCHRVKFFDRIPTAEDVAEIGYLEDGKFVRIAETTAWNFQQGAMLQYHPYLENTVYYNVCENGRFMTVTHNFVTGEKQYTDRATACVSPDGKWGLAVNFGRIFAFRPGYGYAGFVDEGAEIAAPADDGVFLVNMETGKSELIASYERIAPMCGLEVGKKVLVNHITFSPNSDRYVMLFRSFPEPVNGKMEWKTSLITGDRAGNLHVVLPAGMFSHYDWKNDEELLIYCAVEGKKGMYLVNVQTGAWHRYDDPFFEGKGNRDIHCSLSPDGNYIIGDSYPLNDYRQLLAYSLKSGEMRVLAESYRPVDIRDDFRCDLHARFVWGGKAITFDTVHDHKREIVYLSADCLNF
jgi:hypothetical protein